MVPFVLHLRLQPGNYQINGLIKLFVLLFQYLSERLYGPQTRSHYTLGQDYYV